MAWRDRLRPASYRDAAFHIERPDALTAGRRVQVHDYPGRDDPYTEDLGHVTPEYSITGYLVGDDYPALRDRLIAACARPGAGSLIHPYLGAVHVACTECRVSESTRDGRMAHVQMTFVSAGRNRYPTADVDTAAAVTSAADAVDTAAQSQLADAW